MDLRQLRYFLSVAEAGSFVAASRQLNVSQPALGYQVKKLEEDLGVELLARLPRGVALTPAGIELRLHAEAVLDRLHEARTKVSAFRSKPARTFSFGVTPTAGKAMLADFLAACAGRQAPQVAIREGLTVELVNQVRTAQLDFAVCYDPPSQMAAVPLYHEDLFLVGPQSLLHDEGSDIAFAELANFPLVLDTPFQFTRSLIESIACARGVKLNVALQIELVNFKRELLVANRCCTLVPYGLFLDEISANLLQCRQVVDPPIRRTLHLIARPGTTARDFELMHTLLRPIVAEKIAAGRLRWSPVS